MEKVCSIKYRTIEKHELGLELFQDFERHQVVTDCGKSKDNGLSRKHLLWTNGVQRIIAF